MSFHGKGVVEMGTGNSTKNYITDERKQIHFQPLKEKEVPRK
jgi:hypothetical protein